MSNCVKKDLEYIFIGEKIPIGKKEVTWDKTSEYKKYIFHIHYQNKIVDIN